MGLVPAASWELPERAASDLLAAFSFGRSVELVAEFQREIAGY